MDERELVALLYRADWTRLALSGTVRGVGQFPSTSHSGKWWSFGGGEGESWTFDGPEPPPTPPDWSSETVEWSEAESALLLAPGRRYRLARAGGSRLLGCDGERVWQWFRDIPADAAVKFVRRPQPPVAGLLAPAWLLLGYRLIVTGETTVAGRPGVAVTGMARTGPLPGIRGMMLLPWRLVPRPDRVTAVVDAELGILLRRELWSPDGDQKVTEFLTLDVGDATDAAAAADPSVFTAPEGSFFGDGHRAGQRSDHGPLGDIGLEAVKMAAGLAAGGLGAAVKFTPKRHTDPFAAATAEDPDDAMPDDEPLPGWAVDPSAEQSADGADDRRPVSDEVLNLLYRGGLWPAPFSATLHEWTSGDVVAGAMLGAVPESARRAGFGGVGFLIDTVLNSTEDQPPTAHTVSRVRVVSWDKYRVDRVSQVPPTRPSRLAVRRKLHRDPVTVACDGERTFRVFDDEVQVGPVSELDQGRQGDLIQLVDGSWLFTHRLSGGDVVEVDGRTGYRVIVTDGTGPDMGLPMSWLPGWFLPAVAVVDASSGRLLRLTRFRDEKAVTRLELRSLSDDDGSDDFGFTPPEGLRVVDEPGRIFTIHDDDDSDPDSDGDSDSDGAGDTKWFGPDGREWTPPDQVRAVADAFKEQVEEKLAVARGFLGSFLGGRR